MNIACTSCPARYGVADEKINGKRVRITCKRCGTVLVIDGTVSPPNVTASTSVAPGPAGRGASVAPAAPSIPAAPPAPAPEPFLVLFADERQERADVAQIVRFHRAGQLAPETLVWREGMENWQNPWDVEEIASAFRRMGYTRPTPVPAADFPRAEAGEDEATRVAPSGPDASNQPFDDDEATNVVDSSALASKQPVRRARGSRPAANPLREEDEQPTHVGRTPVARTGATAKRTSTAPRGTTSERPQRASTRPGATQAEAARRRESRRPSGSPTAERFANQAFAGSEAEEEARQRVSAAETAGLMDATDEGQRLTGARNETSVLFSLDSLLKKEEGQRKVSEPPRRAPAFEESLLVDSGPSLPAGGGFAPALAAPDFTAPITAPPPQFAPAPATVEPVVYPHADSSRKWMMATAGVVVLSALGFAWMSGVLNPLLGKVGLAPAPSVAPVPEPSAAPAASAEAAPAPTTTAEAEPSATPSASAAAAASASTTASPTAAPPPVAAPAPRTPSAPQAAQASRPAAPAAATATESEPEAAPAAAPAPAAAGEAFDAGAAKTALTAAAGNASSCKEPGGATGNGRVSITFAPSGRPTSVAVTGDLAGTTVGSCVAKLFRQTRVPPFSGEPVTVAKTFSVE